MRVQCPSAASPISVFVAFIGAASVVYRRSASSFSRAEAKYVERKQCLVSERKQRLVSERGQCPFHESSVFEAKASSEA